MDGEAYYSILLALVFVLALILLLAWLARRFGIGSAVAMRTGAARRLRVSEIAAIDAKHRLVLVRRDDVEHLLLLGPGADTLVEAGIAAPEDDDTGHGVRHDLTSFKEHIGRLMHAGRKDSDT